MGRPKSDHKKQPGCCLKFFMACILITITPLALANENLSSNIPQIDLHYEPIQPLTSPQGLDHRKVTLGESLFHDNRLSKDNALSCSSCHDLSNNGADQITYGIGNNGKKLTFNTLTVFNSSLNHRLFWDGRATTLEEQINFVVQSEREFSSNWPVIIGKLKQDQKYVKSFKKIYDNGINADNIRDAIATFERTLITTNSRFDRYLLGDNNAINAEEKSGYRLFKSYGCIACHQGQNVGGNLFMKLGVFKEYFTDYNNQTLADQGRFNITKNEQDRHVFRVPGLRLAALTPPYLHNGAAKTLEQTVHIMAKHQLGRSIPEVDIKQIVAFLKTLPGEYQGQPLGN